ncbi:hypothetical protein E0Z06_07320 [Rheinheimera sp. D18]|nr:hypothetical protein E0Z06_07320 [Rheinheimera sp. D18]
MLRPSEHWFWTYCAQKDRLLLDISNEAQYCSPYSAAQLAYKPQQQPLSIAEAQAFWHMDDSLQQLDIAPAVRLELCLSGLSAFFMQQQAHKSWYFQQGTGCDAKQFDLVILRGLSNQYALVLNAETDCVTCLLLGDISTLAGKHLVRLNVVRVLRNRISRFKVDAAYRYTA